MGKYEPLARYLEGRDEDSWTATFGQIEAKLGFVLPKSAHEHRAWWSNQQGSGHSQKEGWQGAGWETSEVDLGRRTVHFERSRRGAGKDAELRELWHKAHEISGISGRTELERAALTTFIQRLAAKKLIALGGSDPNAEAAPRRRFE